MTDAKTTDEASIDEAPPSSMAAKLIMEADEFEQKANEIKPCGKRAEYFRYLGQARAKRKEAMNMDPESAKATRKLIGDMRKH